MYPFKFSVSGFSDETVKLMVEDLKKVKINLRIEFEKRNAEIDAQIDELTGVNKVDEEIEEEVEKINVHVNGKSTRTKLIEKFKGLLDEIKAVMQMQKDGDYVCIDHLTDEINKRYCFRTENKKKLHKAISNRLWVHKEEFEIYQPEPGEATKIKYYRLAKVREQSEFNFPQ